jgi:hypothetical protein
MTAWKARDEPARSADLQDVFPFENAVGYAKELPGRRMRDDRD